MNRPAFLTSPGAWVRSPRTGRNAVDDACALSRVRTGVHGAHRVIAGALIFTLALLGAINLIARYL
ncbi:MAG: hypothetical protein RL030_1753 [Pseudomonadota bacterium]|jgi:hypothetical protein